MNDLIDNIEKIRKIKPLVHHITNIVTINDCANISLALGGSPIMAMDSKEVEEIVQRADALVLNMGTFNDDILNSMIKAGKKANELKIPIVLDPVGISVSSYRRNSLFKIVEEVKISIIKGNQSEVKSLSGLDALAKGVDSFEETPFKEMINICKETSRTLEAIIVATGSRDIITDGDKIKIIDGGSPCLKNITGTGCMTTSLIGSFAAVLNDDYYSSILGVKTMKKAGEIAHDRLIKEDTGYGSFKVYLIDGISNKLMK